MPTTNLSDHLVGQLVQVLREQGKAPRILEVGSGNRQHFWGLGQTERESLESSIIHVDLFPMCGLCQVIGDVHQLPFRDQCFDLVICQAVLEHVHRPHRAVDEMFRVASNGGYVYAEVPFLQPYHAAPNDFQRYTSEGLRELFRQFTQVNVGICAGPLSALNWFLLELVDVVVLKSAIKRVLRGLLRLIMRRTLFLDKHLSNKSSAYKLASCFYLIAQKD